MSPDLSAEAVAFHVVMGRFARLAGLETDKAVAAACGLSASVYANRKRSGSIPCIEIITYAAAHPLDLNAIFLGQPAAPGPAPKAPTPPGMNSLADAAALVANAAALVAEVVRIYRERAIGNDGGAA